MSDSPTPSTFEHDVPGRPPMPPPAPLEETAPAPRRTPAEEARALVASTNVGTLATHSDDGHPWASLVAFGSLDEGAPVLFVSRLAEHARNLERDPRASLVVADPHPRADVLASGRVTVAGTAERPAAQLAAIAQEAYVEAVPSAKAYMNFRDFSLWVLRVERVRWVGGYGRMDSVDARSYAAAELDPVVRAAPGAVKHLNEDHADALLAMAQALGGYPDAVAATCASLDRYGLDLDLDTARGPAGTRIPFAAPLHEAGELRAATVALARRARGE